jgi:hypothetical protein
MKIPNWIDRIAALFRIRKEPQSTALSLRNENEEAIRLLQVMLHGAEERAGIILSAKNEWADRAVVAEGKLKQLEYMLAGGTEDAGVPLFRRAEPEGAEFKWRWDWNGKAGREWDKVSLTIKHDGLLRIIAGPVMEEPVFLTILAHKQSPLQVNIQSLLYADAGDPTTIWCFSNQPFEVTNVEAKLRLSQETVRKFREKQLQEEGFCGSIPSQDSVSGMQFYQDHPDLVP